MHRAGYVHSNCSKYLAASSRYLPGDSVVLCPRFEKASPLPLRRCALGKRAVPAIVPTLVVAYCLHLPLVEVHVTYSRLVLILQLRFHATYVSSSRTAMEYVIMSLYHCC